MTGGANPFLLVNPPTAEAAAVILTAIDAIDFPWEALAPEVADDVDGAVLVEWDTTPQGTSGLYYGGGNRIVLSNLERNLDPGAAFVFAHEVGHMIDDMALDETARTRLLELMHVDPPQLGHYNHDHPDAGHRAPADQWANGSDAYGARVYEAFADVFVAAYAPAIWQGDPARGWAQHWPRFVHHTDDVDAVRAIVTEAITPPPPPEPEEPELMRLRDVPRDHPDARVIRRAVRLGLMAPRRGGYFRPGRKVTRADLARALVRLHDARP